jgi:hypothetical protein
VYDGAWYAALILIVVRTNSRAQYEDYELWLKAHPLQDESCHRWDNAGAQLH